MIIRRCPHGASPYICPGAPNRGIAPCQPADYRYCSHGVDTDAVTTDGRPRCPHCRTQPPRRP